MKQRYRISLLLLALLLPVTAVAYDFEVDGIYYNIKGNEATVTCKFYDWSDDDYYNDCSGDVIIPSTVTYNGTTYSVTSIGDHAFSHCGQLTSVEIPNSVTSIDNNAFSYCTGLTSVTIPNSVTSIGDYVFTSCTALTSMTVASGNTTFDSRDNCNAIIETSSNTLLYGCKNTVIPNTVTSIGDGAFNYCTDLTSVEIPNSVTSIGIRAFGYCTGLTSVEIPNSVTTIELGVFSGCSGLTSVTIPNSVTSIGYEVFGFCSGLTSVEIPNSVTTIGSRAFINCSGLTSVEIPNSVTSIGNWAFQSCSGLTNVEIPNSVTTIGDDAFYYCFGLTSVTIGNSVTTIGGGAFCMCTGLTNVEIPNSVTSIGGRAFSYCTGLTSVEIPNSVTSIGSDAFSGTAWYDNQPDGLVYAGLVAYKYKGEMPEGTHINITNGTKDIAGGAFSGCSGLTSVEIPNSVISIGGSAFSGCSGLTSVEIPNSVTTIGNFAFNNCSGLTEIYSLALTPATVGYLTFNGCYGATLYVPEAAVDAYKTADYWKDFSIIVGFVGCVGEFEVNGILYRAMNDGTASVIANEEIENYYTGDKVIADTVTFEGNSYVVKYIEENAFSDCYDLTSIVIPNTVDSIGEQAFQGCTGLKSVNIGSGVTAIGAKAFNYCNALEIVKCLGTVPPVMASSDCFSTAAYNRATLLVPRQQIETYQAADYWHKFTHIDGWGSAGPGDVEGDGVISIKDVTTLADALLGSNIDSIYFDAADLNNNGRIDIGDVVTLIDILLNGTRN